jgi:hypothetical protein
LAQAPRQRLAGPRPPTPAAPAARAVRAATAGSWEGSEPHGDPARRPALPRPLLLAGVIATAAAVGLLAGIGGAPSGGELAVDVAQRAGPITQAPPEPVADPSPAAAAAAGSWRTMAPGPLAGRTGHAAVWTGTHLLVWGGWDGHAVFADGAAYHPDDDTWRLLAPAPLSPRARPAASWTGTELLVWGGWDGATALGDGAAYEPATDTWRSLAPAPLSARAGAAAAWTGEVWLVWGGADDDTGRATDGAAYDPLTDTWRSLAAAPLSGEAGRAPRMVWTGTEAVVWALPGLWSDAPAAARYDPAGDRWQPLPPPPGGRRLDPVLSWNGRWLVAWGVTSGKEVGTAAARYSPLTDAWEPMPDPPLAFTGDALLVEVGTGPRASLIAWVGDTPAGGAVHTDEHGWQRLARAPVPGRVGHASIWTGAALLVWGGHRGAEPLGDRGAEPLGNRGAEPLADGAVWTAAPADVAGTVRAREMPPVSPPWEALPDAPGGRLFGPAAVWADGEVVLVGGIGRSVRDPLVSSVLDPATGAWRALPPADPSLGTARFGHLALWVPASPAGGRGEVVVLGGYDTTGRRPAATLALDPATGTWRALAHPGLQVTAAAWTGTEVVAIGRSPSEGAVLLSYAPQEDRWTRLPHPPLERPARAVVWTGREVVLATARGDRLAALDPATQTWRPLPPSLLQGTAVQLAAVDGAVIAALRQPDGWVTAVLDLELDRWRQIGVAPVGRSAIGLLTAGDRVLAVGRPGPELAVLAPGGGWEPLPEVPLPRRHGAGLAWTGDALVVWGGGTSPDPDTIDGALLRLPPER